MSTRATAAASNQTPLRMAQQLPPPERLNDGHQREYPGQLDQWTEEGRVVRVGKAWRQHKTLRVTHDT